MKRLLKSSILSLAVAATTLTAIPADAGDWRRGGHGYYDRYERHGGHGRPAYVHKRKRNNDKDDMVAAGILGLAVGAIAAGVLTQPRNPRPTYIDPPRPTPRYGYERDYYPRAPSYRSTATYAAPEPWSPEWYRACSARYRSFDGQSGTFMGYDGYRHFCEIR